MTILYLLAVIGLVAGLGCASPIPSLPEAEPEDVGLSPDGLGRITAAFQAHADARRMAGAVMVIGRHGKVGYSEAVGLRDMEADAPMQQDTIFRIYSMSKPITSVAVMMLYDEGRFALDDPVSDYIPELGGLQVAVVDSDDVRLVPAERDMTVRDLLRHTSGLTYGFDTATHVHRLYQEAQVLGSRDLAEMTEKLGRLPLKWQPGARWEYSVSTDVLGRLVEVLSGLPYDKFLDERIFGPLGMVDTAFWVTPDRADRLAEVYSPDEDMVLQPHDAFCLGGPGYLEPAHFFSGGGGLVSTAGDYARFAQMLLNGGELDGVRILKPETLDLMTTDQLTDQPRDWLAGAGFGLGFRCNPGSTGRASAGPYGWGGAAHTNFWVDAAKDMFGVWMVQLMPDNGLPYAGEFQQLAYAALDE